MGEWESCGWSQMYKLFIYQIKKEKGNNSKKLYCVYKKIIGEEVQFFKKALLFFQFPHSSPNLFFWRLQHIVSASGDSSNTLPWPKYSSVVRWLAKRRSRGGGVVFTTSAVAPLKFKHLYKQEMDRILLSICPTPTPFPVPIIPVTHLLLCHPTFSFSSYFPLDISIFSVSTPIFLPLTYLHWVYSKTRRMSDRVTERDRKEQSRVIHC